MISKAKLRYIASLTRKKVRGAERCFLVEGVRTCEELLTSKYAKETLLYCPALISSDRGRKLVEAYSASGVYIAEVDRRAFEKISDITNSQGILAVARMRDFDLNEIVKCQPCLMVALDRINEPGNLGTIIRTAVWFGAEAILLSLGSVEFTNPKVIRASMGAGFHIPIVENLELLPTLSSLKNMAYSVVVADAGGEELYSDFPYSPRTVLVLGNETAGVSSTLAKIATASLRIPKRGSGESLNVAVAAGILLEQISKAVFDHA